MTKRKFGRAFKIEAAGLVKYDEDQLPDEWGGTLAQAVRDLDVAESLLHRCRRKLIATPASTFPGNRQTQADLADNAALKREVARLRAQRDILKKAAAFLVREAT